jgi:hypothetical protein
VEIPSLNRNEQTLCPVVRILGVDVAVLSRQAALSLIIERLTRGAPTDVVFANANLLLHAYRDTDLRRSLNKMLVVNDGVGVDIALWWLHKSRFPDNLNGSDFTPQLLARLPLRRERPSYPAASPFVNAAVPPRPALSVKRHVSHRLKASTYRKLGMIEGGICRD